MNWDQVKGSWRQVKGKAQQMWGDLTDDELDVIDGKREELSAGCRPSMVIPRRRPRKKLTAGSDGCN